ncbi:hypothetical protein H9Y04_17970 [Streptomyces sp. TRM66268-LWL]|uniref:Uncharacterized protein n=1 Tax=Streptomyces polyasparticus TaxID=2767826 RepID=A0ABR7SG37_9ACTN|nr:hypothetical protein [Streptomyces polyasparticus]MBC9714450.1 hypothetical protein [Streptomyces polyasparticus]
MQQPSHDLTSAPMSSRPTQMTARERALTRVCEGFRTTISPHSAARLADLMPLTTYAKAA